MRLFLRCIGLLFLIAAGPTACAAKLSVPDPLQQGKSVAGPVTDYSSLIDNLRLAGVSVEPEGEAEQPFFSTKGRMIKVGGEDVQVFQYSRAAVADAQAAVVSSDGSAVGTSKVNWIGPPHFYKKAKLIVLYVGNDNKVLTALDAVLGPQFAGR